MKKRCTAWIGVRIKEIGSALKTCQSSQTHARLRHKLHRLRELGDTVWQTSSPLLFSILGAPLFGFYLNPLALKQLGDVHDLQLAVGSLAGTIVVLGFSLAVIPVQRAAESYSYSVLRLFREDRGIRVCFLGLLLICFVAFLSAAAPTVGIDATFTVPALLFLLAVGLDQLRWLYGRITALLEPQEGVRLLLEESRHRLRQLHRLVRHAAEMAWRGLPTEQQGASSPERLMAELYERRWHDSLVDSRTAELAEIGQKACARNDSVLAQSAIDALCLLAVDSIELRKEALIFEYAGFMTFRATAEGPLERLYDKLAAINRAAIRLHLESVPIGVIFGLARVAEHMTTVRPVHQQSESAPFARLPIAFCQTASLDAMEGGVDQAGYDGSATLARVSGNSPVNIDAVDVHLPIIEGIFKIAFRFASEPTKVDHVAEPLRQGLRVLHVLAERRDSSTDAVVKDFLVRLKMLVLLPPILKANDPYSLLQHPLGPAYDDSSSLSLYALLVVTRNRIDRDAKRPSRDPWSHFADFSEILANHFRQLAEIPGLAASTLAFSVNACVRNCLQLLLGEILGARDVGPMGTRNPLKKSAKRLLF